MTSEISPQQIFAHYAERAMVATNEAIEAFQEGDEDATKLAIKKLRKDLSIAMNVLRREFNAEQGTYINFDIADDE